MSPIEPRRIRSLLAFASLFLCGYLFLTNLASAQDSGADLIKVRERLWLKPGPNQDSPSAPKLLVVYPIENARLDFDEEKTRYAGRVEPADAQVLLDGQPVRVWPGGVFTGLLQVPVGERQVKLAAKKGSASTTVVRHLTRSPQVLGPTEWPLAFRPAHPVEPGGPEDYWLRPGSKLNVKLFASPGHHASVRVGENGNWIEMKSIPATPAQGGAYAGTIIADDKMSATATPVEFMLRSDSKAGKPSKMLTMKSSLKVRVLPPELKLTGAIDKNFGTFLKRADGWDRWGNFVHGSPFPVVEKLGERVKVDYGRGETGFVEMEAVKLRAEPGACPMPDLGAASINISGISGGVQTDRLTIDWKAARPVAAVFLPDAKDGARKLTIHLIGASKANAAILEAPPSSFFETARVIPAEGNSPPRVEVRLRGDSLWGYGLAMSGEDTLRLTVRAQPEVPAPSAKKPLGGVRIMIDPGHGGDDIGAIGPSGLCEADITLITSTYLAARLKQLGATVNQLRTEDATVSLDARVDKAIAWDPDLFISVHYNSVSMGTDPMADVGPKVFYHYPHSIHLASAVDGPLVALFGSNGRTQVLPQVFRVNRNVSPCPSILVEGAFICNPADEVHLRDTRQLRVLAEAIAEGVLRTMRGGGS